MRVMYQDGPQPSDDDVLESLWAQCDDLGELEDDCLLIAPTGATQEQVDSALQAILGESDVETSDC